MLDIIDGGGQKVVLLNHSPEPDRTVALSARLCYSKKDFAELDQALTEDKIEELVSKLAEMGHLSPFEHVIFTFGISNISRSASHQLVRHRLASYSQQSHRYTKSEGRMYLPYVPVDVNIDYEEAEQGIRRAYQAAYTAYQELLSQGVPAGVARYVLPQGVTSNIIVTMNARELLNFFRLRCCMRAQHEIREIANKMLHLCKEVAPNIFKYAGASCIHGECSEGEHKAEVCKRGYRSEKTAGSIKGAMNATMGSIKCEADSQTTEMGVAKTTERKLISFAEDLAYVNKLIFEHTKTEDTSGYKHHFYFRRNPPSPALRSLAVNLTYGEFDLITLPDHILKNNMVRRVYELLGTKFESNEGVAGDE